MKIAIEPKLLADTIAWAARTLPTRPNVPVLAGLLLEVGDDTLTVSAFDYDMSARATIPCDVAEPGRALVPGRMLAEVAKALPTKSFVDIAATDTDATLACGRSDFSLRLLPVDDYPTLPDPPEPAGTIDADQLAAAVAQVYPATSSDDTLPMLTGIRLDTKGDKLTVAATDRYRIAVTDTTWTPATKKTALGAVIPGRHLHDIVKGLSHGPITIGLNEAMAAFTSGDRQTTVRLLDEQFIDYRARVGITADITATVDAAELAAAVKRVALVADRSTAIRLAFTADEVTARAGTDDIGRGNETVECALEGDPIDIAFQATYLLDALGAIDGHARIGMTGPVKPALFSSQTPEDGDGQTVPGGHKQLVMSLRLS